MAGLLFRIATVVVAVGSGVPTVIAIRDPKWLAPVLLTLLILAGIVVVVLEVREWRALRPRGYRSESEIRKFMLDWISREGRVAVYTRDMSWAQNDEGVRQVLRTKAAANELTVCLPSKISLTDDLEAHGATIYAYGPIAYGPVSRFTIIRQDREDAEVAIGRRIAGLHTIATYSRGSHSAFALAEDLVQFAKRTHEARNS